jgi:mono/diheme cytochrome c family protein
MHVVKSTLITVVVFGLGGLAACGGSTGERAATSSAPAPAAPAAPVITAEARKEAAQIFSTRCSVCHGTHGYGDGPGSSSLNPKPRNYHDPAWQQEADDHRIETAIVYGGAAIGRSPAMVANPDLGNKPLVVAALRELIRGFGLEPQPAAAGAKVSPKKDEKDEGRR